MQVITGLLAPRFSTMVRCLSSSFVLLGLFLSAAAWPGQAQAADSALPLTVIQAQGAQTWRWSAVDELAERSAIASFGARGDIPLLSRWFSADEARPGVAVFEKERKEISWRSLTPAGRLELVTFGGEGDVVVAGADFDGSGLDDIAVTKLVNGKARWRVRLDPFGAMSDQAQERSFVFGQNGDRVFYAAPRGAEDWVGIVRKGRSGRAIVRLRQAITAEVLSFARFPGRVAEGLRPRPIPLKDASGSILLVFPFQTKESTELLITNLTGGRVARFVRRGVDSIAVGNFDGLPGEEIALLVGENVKILSVEGRAELSRRVGTVLELVDEVQVAGFSAAGNNGNVVTSCSVANPLDGAEGFVWKPNSDTQYFAVVVLAPSLTGDAVRVTTKQLNGTPIKELRYKGVGNGGRTAWQDFSLTGAAYKASYGQIQIEVELRGGGCLSYLIRDPSVRID